MTRLASIMGVATVATLVLLSGCESAVKTDYAKNLEGRWTTAELPGTVDRPDGPLYEMLPEKIPVTRMVTVTIQDGSGQHEGTFSLTVTSTPTAMEIQAA